MDGIQGPPAQEVEPQQENLADLSVSNIGETPQRLEPEDKPVDSIQSGKPPDPPPRMRWLRPVGFGMIALGAVVAAIIVFRGIGRARPTADIQSGTNTNLPVKQQQVALPVLTAQLGAGGSGASTLTVNGQVSVSDSLILSPTLKPSSAVPGQMYFDQSSDRLGYYNGTGFIYLQGSGSSVTNITNNNVTNSSNVTNVTNAATGGSTGTSGGTAGTVAVFTGPDTLGDSLITEQAGTVTVGGATIGVGATGNGETVTLGSGGGASTTTLQGGTGGLNLSTGSQAGSSGNVIIESGASSTTASGNVTVDAGSGVVSGTVVTDKTFEDGPDNMTDGFGYHDTVAQSTVEAHGGTHSLSVTVGLDPLSQPGWKITDEEPFTNNLTGGHTYRISFWVRAGTTSSAITAYANWSDNGFDTIAENEISSGHDNSGAWTEVAGTLTAPLTAVNVGLELDADATTVGEVHYIDDFTVTDLDSSSATSELNLGATNAMIVNIGNANQIGATTVLGGGVNIEGGLQTVNVTGAVINATSGGASYTTTSGALDITAGGSSTWRIGNSTGGGGDLTIASGNAGGNNNGGDLTLQGGAAAGNGIGGSVNVDSAANTGASGNINIDTGASSTTAAGNISIDTGSGIISGTIVDDRDFESGDDNVVSWFGDTAGATTDEAHGGLQSLEETGIAPGGSWGIISDHNDPGAPITAGHHYFFTAWVRAATTAELINSAIVWFGTADTLSLNSVTDSTTGWTEITGSGIAPAGATQAYWEIGGVEAIGEIHYFDDLVTTDLSSSSAVSEVDLGNTNAQIINIGNLNEIGTTTIEGGSGIALNSGASSFDISGGELNISAGAASVIETTAGALDINSAGAATWNVGSGTGGAGGNFVLEAGNAAAGSLDGGNLVLSGGAATGTGTPGSVVIKPEADFSDALSVQDATGDPLLTADTVHMTVTVVNLIVQTTLEVDGHIVTGGTAPTIVADAAACTAPTLAISGTDTTGTIFITPGSGCPGAGDMAQVKFASAFGADPRVTLTPADSAAQTLGAYVDDAAETPSGFDVGTVSTPSTGVEYEWNYFAAQ